MDCKIADSLRHGFLEHGGAPRGQAIDGCYHFSEVGTQETSEFLVEMKIVVHFAQYIHNLFTNFL